jgi:hypothetical protein
VRGEVVTCVLVDAVAAFQGRTSSSADRRGATDLDLTPAHYAVDAVEVITRLTRQRVTSFISSHDPETDVATEVFELETPASRRPYPSRNLRYAQFRPAADGSAAGR